MKSEKAKQHLSRWAMNPNSPIAQDQNYVWRDVSVIEAIEIAEQEAEGRMREKAIEAHRKVCFFRNPKDNTCANTATKCGEHSCYYMNYFIQKTDRE